VDYFPLTVDYEEKFYAAGKIKGSRFMKREGRPTDEAILIARMIDRALRPLFNQTSRRDLQIVLTVFSIDEDNDPDIPCFVATSCALAISSINYQGTISGLRIGLINGEFILNPSYTAREKSEMDLVVASTDEDKVIMLEAEAKEVKEETVLQAIDLATKHNRKIIDLIKKIQQEVGRPKVFLIEKEDGEDVEVIETARRFLAEKIPIALFNEPKASKAERQATLVRLEEELEQYLTDKQIGKEKREKAKGLIKKEIEKAVASAIIKEGKRVDDRKLDEIRSLNIDVGIFSRTHGSAHFSRGETQVVSIVTLGSPGDVLFLETMEVEEKKSYMHHYNFPPFSVGEVAPLRGPGRREIGHGALAEKALRAVLPAHDEFPYTIRVVSEVLSSNGSSSMASTCGSSLALMDAGVPIKRHVAGIAMGLASNEKKGEYVVIADLQDLEDGEGGMDFKICGSEQGITAIQLDTKTKGLPDNVIQEVFQKARLGLNQILAEMSKVIVTSRPELSPYAPRIYILHIDPEKIGLVIGPQGKVINKIIEQTNVEIDIEKDGTVHITSLTKDGAEQAIKQIEDLTREVKVGEVYEGKVSRILDFGAMVELTPNQEGMVHVSNLSDGYVRSVTDVVQIGDTLRVRVIEIDNMGRINLTVDGVSPKERNNNHSRGSGFNRSQNRFDRYDSRRPPRPQRRWD
jgi:polyribonucleotide nucleotidyltransferase